jgi:uncharacterized membrane protein
MNTSQDTSTLKRLATTVYLCQLLSFTMLGLPLLVGVAINFFNRKAAQGTWIESHFNWQIQTAWVTLAGFAIAGFALEFGFALYILLPTIMLLIYRIVIGWNALNTDREVKSSN